METLKEVITRIPHEPGVYLYRNNLGEVIYIGKAKDLSKRVKQYFQRQVNTSEKTERLVSEIKAIETTSTTSEFDAILLEAKLIRKNLPKYNVISRDDKSPLFVVMTFSEELPRILTVRRSDLPQYEKKARNRVYGPFQSGYTLRMMLRQLRSIVPFCIQNKRNGKPCFYTHLGLCDPCPSAIGSIEDALLRQTEIKRYRSNVLRLRKLFEGNIRWLSSQYEKEMRHLASDKQFEEAAVVHRRLLHLTQLSSYRYDPQVFLDRGSTDIFEEELEALRVALTPHYPQLSLRRIECFDISNLMGTYAVGSMVVCIDGKIEKQEYRKFRIRTVKGISDVAMMKEVLTRRLKHTEWELPDLLIVDGGKPQAAVATAVTKSFMIPLAGLAKREEELIIPKTDGSFVTLRLPLSGQAIKVLQRIRDEAHRFAITYHKRLRDRAFLDTIR